MVILFWNVKPWSYRISCEMRPVVYSSAGQPWQQRQWLAALPLLMLMFMSMLWLLLLHV